VGGGVNGGEANWASSLTVSVASKKQSQKSIRQFVKPCWRLILQARKAFKRSTVGVTERVQVVVIRHCSWAKNDSLPPSSPTRSKNRPSASTAAAAAVGYSNRRGRKNPKVVRLFGKKATSDALCCLCRWWFHATAVADWYHLIRSSSSYRLSCCIFASICSFCNFSICAGAGNRRHILCYSVEPAGQP